MKTTAVILGLVALAALLDLRLLGGDGGPKWAYFPGFHAVFGLGAAGVIILLAGLCRRWLERPPGYYRETENDE